MKLSKITKSAPWFALSLALLAGMQSATAGTLLLLGAENGIDGSSFIASFTATGKFSTVTYLDTTSAVPALAALSSYDAVFAWTNNSPAAGLGDVLADYYDLGGKSLTLATYSFSAPWGISGRVRTGSYAAFADGGPTGSVSGIVNQLVADPIFAGVNMAGVSFGNNANYAHPTIAPGATLLADDGAGVAMIARSSNGVVNMNMWPNTGSSDFFKLAANTVTTTVPEPSVMTTLGLVVVLGCLKRRRAI